MNTIKEGATASRIQQAGIQLISLKLTPGLNRQIYVGCSLRLRKNFANVQKFHLASSIGTESEQSGLLVTYSSEINKKAVKKVTVIAKKGIRKIAEKFTWEFLEIKKIQQQN